MLVLVHISNIFKAIPFVAGCGSGAAATLMGALLPCPGSKVCHVPEVEVSIVMGVPKMDGFLRENPIKNG